MSTEGKNSEVASDQQVVSDKDRNLDRIFWFKIALSLVAGCAYGLLGVTGFMSFVLYFVISTFVAFMYFRKFVASDDEVEYQSEVFMEGLNVAVPAFLLLWTICYTVSRTILVSNLDNEF